MSFNSRDILDAVKKEEGTQFSPSDILGRVKNKNVSVVEETLGPNFDPENVASFGLRMKIARGDNLEEKKLQLRQEFPDGDLTVFQPSVVLGNEKPVMMFRESEEQAWKMVDRPGFMTGKEGEEPRTITGAWGVLRDPRDFDWTDIPEAMVSSGPALAAEIAVTLHPAAKAFNVMRLVGAQALAAFTGESLDQAEQSISGTQAQTPAEIFMEPVYEGGMSAVGGYMMSPFVAARNVAGGRGALRIGAEGEETLRAAGRLDKALPKGEGSLLEGITPLMVSDNPLIQIAEKQSGTVLPALQRRYRDMIGLLNKAVEESVDKQARSGIIENVVGGLKDLGRNVVNRLKINKNPMSAGGRALQAGIEEYDKVAHRIVKDAYSHARSIEEPNFNFEFLDNTIADLRKGSRGTLNSGVDTYLKELQGIRGPITLSDGSMVSVTDQIRNARTGLFEAAHVKPGEIAGQTQAQAGKAIEAVNRTLENPLNVNPEFLKAWKIANEAASLRRSTLGQLAVIKAARSETPATLARNLAKPGQVDDLKVLRDVVDTKRWNEFQESFFSDLLADPGKSKGLLESFDQETLDVLMSRTDQQVWSRVTQELDDIAKIGAEEIAHRQMLNKNFMGKLIEEADPRTIAVLRNAAKASDKEVLNSLRAGIVDWAWDGVVTHSKGGLEVSGKKMAANVQKLKDVGLWKLLDDTQRQVVSDATQVAKAFQNITDAGTSIQAAEAGKGLRELKPTAVKTIVSSWMVSQFYLSPAGRKILLGSGLPSSNGRMLRLLGAALAETTTPVDVEALLLEQETAPRGLNR